MPTLAAQRFAVACLPVVLLFSTAAAISARRAAAPHAGMNRVGQAGAQNPVPKLSRTLHVTVTSAYGKFVVGLSRDAFTVFDNKQRQEIVSFSQDDAPVSVVFLLEASTHMEHDHEGLGRAKKHIENIFSLFIEKSHPANEYSLITYNREPRVLLDRSTDTAAARAALSQAARAEFKRGAALYDALTLAVSKAAAGAHQKRAVIILSHGPYVVSERDSDALRRSLGEGDVLVYPISIIDRGHPETEQYWRAALDGLAEATGGKSLFPYNEETLTDSLERIALELRSQYSIGINLTAPAKKGSWHEIKVEVAGVQDPASGKTYKLYQRARKGFYAPAGSN